MPGLWQGSRADSPHPMFGQRASSHTVCRLSSRSLPLMCVYLSPPGTDRFSQSGLRTFSCDVMSVRCQPKECWWSKRF